MPSGDLGGDSHDRRGEEGAEDVPLHRKRAFGSGLHRQRVAFVPASSGDPTAAERAGAGAPAAKPAVSDLYLSIVLPGGAAAAGGKPEAPAPSTSSPGGSAGAPGVCEVCGLPLPPSGDPGSPPRARAPLSAAAAAAAAAAAPSSAPPARSHEASLVHQVCLAHSHPPSALDRSRMGLAVLAARGWDPDARRGLGAAQQGIAHPLRARPKDDKLGLGVEVPRDLESSFRRRQAEREKARQGLDAKKVRKMARDDRRKTERLREQIFGRVDLDRYLGTG